MFWTFSGTFSTWKSTFLRMFRPKEKLEKIAKIAKNCVSLFILGLEETWARIPGPSHLPHCFNHVSFVPHSARPTAGTRREHRTPQDTFLRAQKCMRKIAQHKHLYGAKQISWGPPDYFNHVSSVAHTLHCVLCTLRCGPRLARGANIVPHEGPKHTLLWSASGLGVVLVDM